MANQSRYRVVDFLGGRILESRELMTLQSIIGGVNASDAQVVFDLDQVYRPGATQNITCTISGRTVTFGPTNSALPMVVFVRGRWEILSTGDLPPATLSSTQQYIYLNYSIDIVTYNGAGGTLTDATLVDVITGQATAQMGQIDFSIGVTNTSTTGLNSALQLEKNVTPIIMFQFTTGTGTMTQIALDNANSPALASLGVSGLVSLTTNTAAGVAVSTDDPRMTNTRTPTPVSVIDASVRVPVAAGGTNVATALAKYNLTGDPGGISADKVIYLEQTCRLSDYLGYLYSQILAAAGGGVLTFNNRSGNVLPKTGDYTAAMVSAAPATHVGLPLVAALATGTITSHPAAVTVGTGGGGMAVTQTGGVVQINNPINFSIPLPPAAFGLFEGSTLMAGLLNNGDFFTVGTELLNAAPGGSPLHHSGEVQSFFALAQVLVDHVNQTTGSTNPHNVTLNTLGGAVNNTQNGYISIPVSSIVLTLQWLVGINDLAANTSAAVTENWPIAFPHACLAAFPFVQCDTSPSPHNGQGYGAYLLSKSPTQIEAYMDCGADGVGVASHRMIAFGIGY
jgi:hypothetical protein